MYIYDDFMRFSEWEKSLVHGGTMVMAGLGALKASPLVRRLDKKPSVYVLLLIACFGNTMVVALFATGWVPVGFVWRAIPLATLVFMVFHCCYHLGATAANTIANSMMADVSEINRYRTGILKDGSYSAMLSFVLKMSISFGQLLCGLSLDLMGFDSTREHQTRQVAQSMMLVAFVGGTVITLVAMICIARYPVNRAYMAGIKAGLDARGGPRLCDACGFDLAGNVSGVCPECGEPVTATPSPPDVTAPSTTG
jgi:GPH family glycoside/pentoside/hexuronide:cation symporter